MANKWDGNLSGDGNDKDTAARDRVAYTFNYIQAV